MQGENDETTNDVAQTPIPEGQQDETATNPECDGAAR